MAPDTSCTYTPFIKILPQKSHILPEDNFLGPLRVHNSSGFNPPPPVPVQPSPSGQPSLTNGGWLSDGSWWLSCGC